MADGTGSAQVRERCGELVGSLGLRAPYDRQMFSAVLGKFLGSTVRIVPLRLPVGCASVWLGFTGVDRIGCNTGWPGHEIDLTGHAIGHLVLGHCGDTRDGGQFACTVPSLSEDDRRSLSRFMHESAEGGVSRLFSDGEERAAAVYSRVLCESLGIRRPRLGTDCSTGPQLTCLG
ncbi:MAG: hypothetical protein JO345_33180 [Streptosporangiaceae bacterium]|nr:hypothetical protein [Streptosporangiaceae bacterium]